MRQSDPLIPDAVAAPRQRIPGKRGRGATALRERVYETSARNPTGSYKLEFSYRPLAEFCDDIVFPDGKRMARYAVAEELAIRYFQRIGGVRIIADKTMRLICTALRKFTPQEIDWAIKAKAETLQRDAKMDESDKRRLFTPKAFNFFEIENIGSYLERCPQYVAARANTPEHKAARQAVERMLEQAHLDRLQQPAKPAAAAGPLEIAQREAPRMALYKCVLKDLRAPGLATMLAAVGDEFRSQCRRHKLDPADVRLDPYLEFMRFEWARLRWPDIVAELLHKHLHGDAS